MVTEVRFPTRRRSALCTLKLAAGEERYRWVNDVFAVVEADVRPSADPERWQIRAYECVIEIGAVEP